MSHILNTRWQTLRLMLSLPLAAVVLACLFSVLLPPSASLLAPTSTLPPTATHTPTVTFTPSPAEFITPHPQTFWRVEYYQRDVWERVVAGAFLVEDFENDPGGSGDLRLPYFTSHKFMLSGKSSVEILRSPQLLETGNLLYVRDGKEGLILTLPDHLKVIAFGFDYTSAEEWVLTAPSDRYGITFPGGRNKFVGVLVNQDFPDTFTLTSSASGQGGLSIDNISYVPYIP